MDLQVGPNWNTEDNILEDIIVMKDLIKNDTGKQLISSLLNHKLEQLDRYLELILNTKK